MSDLGKPQVSILIAGPSRTGKTSAANILAERYGIDNVKIGEKFRELTGIETSKFVERDPSIDKRMDEFQAEMIRTATPDKPFILEARLAAFLASKARAEHELPIVTVLFWAPEDVRMQRQLRKVRRDDPRSQATLDSLLEGEREREAKDRRIWKDVHPELDDKNVFDPQLTDPAGRAVYDFVVDTRIGMPEACADVVQDLLVEMGAFGGNH